MKKKAKIILSSLLIVGTVILGYCDGGDITAALIFALLMVAILFDKEEKKDVL